MKRVSFEDFCAEVKAAVLSLPEPFFSYMANVVVDVLEEPTREDWLAIGEEGPVDDEDELFGLFVGVPITEQEYGVEHPNRVKIFRAPLERVSVDRDDLRRNIRDTVLHELAHHFGYSEEDLDEFEASRWPDEEEDGPPL